MCAVRFLCPGRIQATVSFFLIREGCSCANGARPRSLVDSTIIVHHVDVQSFKCACVQTNPLFLSDFFCCVYFRKVLILNIRLHFNLCFTIYILSVNRTLTHREFIVVLSEVRP